MLLLMETGIKIELESNYV